MMQQWIVPIAFILLGFLGGLIGEKVFFKKLREFVIEKQIPGGDIIFTALHRMTFFWFFASRVLWGFFVFFPEDQQ
jgi:hypothetical protein